MLAAEAKAGGEILLLGHARDATLEGVIGGEPISVFQNEAARSGEGGVA